MTKNNNEILKKTNIQKKAPSLKVSKKNTSKPTKKVILETPILDQASVKKSKKISSTKKPEPKAIGSLSEVKKELKETATTATTEVTKTNAVSSSVSKSQPKKKSHTTLKPVDPKRIHRRNGKLLANSQILVRPKRKLKLNIAGKMTPEEEELINSIIYYKECSHDETITPKKEIAINQNSTFFNEPSIFEKFDIEVSKATVEENKVQKQEVSAFEEFQIPIVEYEKLDFVSEEIPDEFKDEIERKKSFINNTSNEYDFISTDIPAIKNTDSSDDFSDINLNHTESADNTSNNTILDDSESKNDNVSDVINILEPTEVSDIIDLDNININDINIDDINLDNIDINDINIENINSDDIDINDINIEDINLDDIDINGINVEDINLDNININDINTDDINSEDSEKIDSSINTDSPNMGSTIVKEAADNIITPESSLDSASNNNFFNSSIPEMEQNLDNSYFKKIKKSIISNISTVFKKFSYDESSIVNLDNNVNENEITTFDNIALPVTLDSKSSNEDIENVTLPINNIPVSADSQDISLPSIDEKLLENNETTLEDSQNAFDNILSTQSDIPFDVTNANDISIDDIKIGFEESQNSVENKEPNILTFEENSEEINNQNIEEIVDEHNDINVEENNDESTIKDIEEDISDEELDKELDEALGITQDTQDTQESEENDEFSIEEYFGITTKEEPEEDFEEIDETDEADEIDETDDEVENENQEEISDTNFENEQTQTFSKLIESFTQTISNLSNKITELENNISSTQTALPNNIEENNEIKENNEITESNKTEIPELATEDHIEDNPNDSQITTNDLQDINIEDISLDDIDLEDLEDFESEPSLFPNQDENENPVVEDILLKAFDNHPDINDQMKQDLLSEVLSAEDTLQEENKTFDNNIEPSDVTSDFYKIIDSLSKTISELESSPQEPKSNNVTIDEVAPIPEVTSDKAINILINKDDIFSIAISNETYEIVTDFDGISVLSENIHISTPKNNFYVNIGEKYIEIHKKPDLFVVNTNFEDIEFANAINNVTFAKKKNKIELNIKEAFKISSVNKKIELSMLNTSIANLTSAQEKNESDSSICDNKTLVINEETQKVYLPYTLEEVMRKLNNSSDYQSLEDVIEQEYTLPLSTFKMPIISRFREAYKFMRTKENSSVYAALDLAVELMFNSNLNPAIIRASKDLKELNIYLDCLYENELDKFDCFKVVYKVLPKIQ